MSVLIKNVKMPESCLICVCDLPMRNCDLWKKQTPEEHRCERHPDCPLVEIQTPHGRLIDADALVKSMRDFSYMWGERMNDEWVGEAPTIIESEDGDP